MDKARILWDRFSKTGKLADYISYARAVRFGGGKKRDDDSDLKNGETTDQSSL